MSSKNNGNKAPKINVQAEGPALSLKVEEYSGEGGMSPEQVAVMQSLPQAIGDGKAEEQKKERHPDRLKASELASPVATVKAMFTALHAADPTMTRKAMLDVAISKGIAFYTARTQYQVWKKGGADSAPINVKPTLDLNAFAAGLAKSA